ncbi:hypothetical protein MTO96_016153 [Rhipicephalus appendiculatus]
MATVGSSTEHLRRNTRSFGSVSLLPGEGLIKYVPTGIPDEERLRILLRLCFKRTLYMLNEEIDSFGDIHHELLFRSRSMFDDEGSDGAALSKLLKLTTCTDEPACKAPDATVAKRHKQLQSLMAECKRWRELAAMEVNLELEWQPSDNSAFKIPVSRQRHYDMLAANAERASRVAAACVAGIRVMNSDRGDEQSPGEDTFDKFDVFIDRGRSDILDSPCLLP